MLISIQIISLYYPLTCPNSISHNGSVGPDVSVSLLSLLVTTCGLALFGVSLFFSWKLCWVPRCDRGLPEGLKDGQGDQQPVLMEMDGVENEYSEDCVKEPSGLLAPESAMKISHTSPDIPLEVQSKPKENHIRHIARVQRQITEPTSSVRSAPQHRNNNKAIQLTLLH